MEKISPEERQGLEKGAFVIEPLLQTLRLYDDVIETNPPLKKKRDALELEARSSQNHEEVQYYPSNQDLRGIFQRKLLRSFQRQKHVLAGYLILCIALKLIGSIPCLVQIPAYEFTPSSKMNFYF